MQRDKLTLKYPVAVEGKYDKIRLSNVIDSHIIVLSGFSAFKNEKTIETLRLYGKNGIILLTDPDKAGTFIRGKLKTLLGGVNIFNVFAPPVKGSDSRRNHVCKDKVLGIESTDEDVLYNLLLPYAVGRDKEAKDEFLTSARAYSDSLTGGKNSASIRKALCAELGLPDSVSAKTLTEYINQNLKEQEYVILLEKARKENDK